MARVTNYSTLATAVQTYLGRGDVGVSSGNLDYLCSEVEEELNARLRVRRMLTAHNSPTISAAGVLTLPTDFLGWKRFQARDGYNEWDLKLTAAEASTSITPDYVSTGRPVALLTYGASSQIWPYDSSYTYRGLYFAKIPELTSSATTNWVITNFPNVYLYGCLAAAKGLIQEDVPAGASRFDGWAQRFNRLVKNVQMNDAWDLDARTHAELSPDTTLFTGGGVSNIESDE